MKNTTITIYPKIDIHCHIIPNVDDGVQNIFEFDEALKQIINSNVKQIVCTPHFNSIIGNDALQSNFKTVQKELLKNGIKSYLSFEFKLNYDNISLLKQQLFKTNKTIDYLLVEFNRDEFISKKDAYSLIEEVMDMGYKVVLAHPEFYINYYDIDFIAFLKDNDVIIQCDASSFIKGKCNKKVYKFAKKLLRNGLIDIISSDYHDPIIRNYDNLNICFDYIKRKYGLALANRLFYDNPKYLIDNFIKE